MRNAIRAALALGLVAALLFPSDADAARKRRGNLKPVAQTGEWFGFGPFMVPEQAAGPAQPRRRRVKAGRPVSGGVWGEISRLRARYGAGAVRVIAGTQHRYVAGSRMLSCHATGEAADVYISAAALADARRTSLGIITYSGRMHHVHLSSCARERGYRGHKRS